MYVLSHFILRVCRAMLNLSVADSTAWLTGAWLVYFHTSDFTIAEMRWGEDGGGDAKERKHGGNWSAPAHNNPPPLLLFRKIALK